jgi:hypothetical protein
MNLIIIVSFNKDREAAERNSLKMNLIPFNTSLNQGAKEISMILEICEFLDSTAFQGKKNGILLS